MGCPCRATTHARQAHLHRLEPHTSEQAIYARWLGLSRDVRWLACAPQIDVRLRPTNTVPSFLMPFTDPALDVDVSGQMAGHAAVEMGLTQARLGTAWAWPQQSKRVAPWSVAVVNYNGCCCRP